MIYGGDILIFARSGKFLRKINRQGSGAEEYVHLSNLVIDFETEECFVHDIPRKKVHVYSFEGVYKRSFPCLIPGFSPLCDYNKDYLIGYYDGYSSSTQRCEDTHPYYLIDKKNGELIPLKLTVLNGISRTLTTIKEKLTTGEFYASNPSLPIRPLLTNGNDILIADFSLDTLYSFKDMHLTPIAIKTPSARSTDPPTIVAPELYTDSLLFFRVIPMYYNESNYYKPYEEASRFVWNRNTNQVENWDLYNSDIDAPMTKYPSGWLYLFNKKNMGTLLYRAEDLVELYNEGKLKGELKEIASRLDEEDNRVLLIAKYK